MAVNPGVMYLLWTKLFTKTIILFEKKYKIYLHVRFRKMIPIALNYVTDLKERVFILSWPLKSFDRLPLLPYLIIYQYTNTILNVRALVT